MTTKTYDAILLLGGGINTDGSLPDAAKSQLQMAAKLFQAQTARAIITTGLHGYKDTQKPPLSEAKAYAEYAAQLGVDRDNIYLEERSQETLGNVLFAKLDILIPHKWSRILVLPGRNHLTKRVAYILRKVLGPDFTWDIVRTTENLEAANIAREKKSLQLTEEINDAYRDGDHKAIHAGLFATHPAYGGTKWTTDELRNQVGN